MRNKLSELGFELGLLYAEDGFELVNDWCLLHFKIYGNEGGSVYIRPLHENEFGGERLQALFDALASNGMRRRTLILKEGFLVKGEDSASETLCLEARRSAIINALEIFMTAMEYRFELLNEVKDKE